MRFDGPHSPDIAFSLPNAVAVYRWDGTLRWRQELAGTATALTPATWAAAAGKHWA